MKLHDFLRLMQEMLKDTGFEGKTYLVGGVVRDHLLGKTEFDDFDLAVERKYGGLKLGAFLNHRLYPDSYEVFPKFGSARMEWSGIKLDFVETRKERYQAGHRYPRISFGTIEEDFLRRDFSINALYLELFSEKILDPSKHGLKDLRAGNLRTLRDPEKVFSEDILRILRAIRFSAHLDFDLDFDTLLALRKHAPKLKRLSENAISREINKMKAGGSWDRACRLMRELDIDFSLFDSGSS